MQYAIVILDGASGEPVPEFNNRTSLEVSETPHLDVLAQTGMVGLVQNVPAHLESSSNVACLSIAGYDPACYPIGRGAIEGAALGIDLQPGQIAFRLNLCNVADGIMQSYSTDNISTEDSHALAAELKEALDDDTFVLYPGVSFRHILVVDGQPELMNLSYEAPHDHTDKNIEQAYRPQYKTPKEKAAADLLVSYMDRAREVLENSTVNLHREQAGMSAANFAWVFWPGEKPASLKSFEETYHKKAAMNSAVDLLDGIALLTGMRIYKYDGVTDGPDNDFSAQGKGAIQMLEDGNDVVIIHVEAPDTAGHDGRSDEKQASIEESDREIIAPLIEYAKQNQLRIAVMPDHPTPLSTRKHSREPVPFVVSGPGIEANEQKRLTEQDAEASGVMIDPGYTFLANILLADKVRSNS